MDRDQRSRQQKSRGGSFTRPAQKRSLSSRMGLQKQRPQTTASRRPAPNPNPQPQRRQTPPAQQYRHATQQLNPQKAGYTPGAPRRQRRGRQNCFGAATGAVHWAFWAFWRYWRWVRLFRSICCSRSHPSGWKLSTGPHRQIPASIRKMKSLPPWALRPIQVCLAFPPRKKLCSFKRSSRIWTM